MPSKKMTAKKSTGGSAPRVVITLEAADDVSDASQSDEMDVASDGSHHNDFCIVCRDGAVEPNSLVCCSECPRVVCVNCMDIPAAFQHAVLADDVLFQCICCYISQQESRRRQENGPSRLPYFGFHYSDGRPVLDRFLNIRATLELSLRAQISSAPVLFVHLKIVDYDATGGSFDLAYDFLKPYFPCGGLERREVTFDIATTAKAANYQRSVDSMVRALKEQGKWDRVVIGISDHTDNDNGDPFAGYDGKKRFIAARVDNFLDIILKPWQGLVDHASESYLWFFCCGALVNNIESFKTLQTSILRHRMSAAVAFTAPRFQPSFTSHLLLAFAEIVLLERFAIHNSFPHMLGQSFKLGRHTDIFLMTPDKDQLTVTKYCWTHIDHRPWGHYLPLLCPSCGVGNAWRSASKSRVYTFECTNHPCRTSYTFKQPEGSRMLHPGKTGSSCWISIPWKY
ncbi:uncharacterized protein EDB91DRAFT_1254768 [Suillus paluster]|uniref:uncharacterized protein n=1 Tax=Suillus paluster TaxID=48578 RepID=UPI001B85B3D7|nr:uncharacterized protein EDB91DRAFT_1254768 [Suillus paluster]KAG1725504.1 hypothetical protein EDB91DRAFT_1254768 [Suillus paluster]